MKDLTEAKALIASIQAAIDQILTEVNFVQAGLDEALGMVCAADVKADADELMERATEAIGAKGE